MSAAIIGGVQKTVKALSRNGTVEAVPQTKQIARGSEMAARQALANLHLAFPLVKIQRRRSVPVQLPKGMPAVPQSDEKSQQSHCHHPSLADPRNAGSVDVNIGSGTRLIGRALPRPVQPRGRSAGLLPQAVPRPSVDVPIAATHPWFVGSIRIAIRIGYISKPRPPGISFACVPATAAQQDLREVRPKTHRDWSRGYPTPPGSTPCRRRSSRGPSSNSD